jgi:hypothetical protein
MTSFVGAEHVSCFRNSHGDSCGRTWWSLVQFGLRADIVSRKQRIYIYADLDDHAGGCDYFQLPYKGMPSLKVIQAAIAELPSGPPLVVAISGGTTGIGSYIANSFASTFAGHGSRLRVYIIGRNAARAKTVLSYGRITSPGSDWHFVHATDLSLISEVDRCCKEIIELEKKSPLAGGPPRVDHLYMTHSFSAVQANVIHRVLSCNAHDGMDSD